LVRCETSIEKGAEIVNGMEGIIQSCKTGGDDEVFFLGDTIAETSDDNKRMKLSKKEMPDVLMRETLC
jgi:hypothetical protein